MRFLPGFAGAVAGFALLKLVAWLGLGSLLSQGLVFLVAYGIVTVAADAAMKRYGTPSRKDRR